MKDGKSLGATFGTHSNLPHQSRQGCNFSLTEGEKSPRDILPKELPDLNGPNFLGSTSCCSCVTLSSGTSVVISCASVSERIHSSSSNCFEVGSFSVFENMSCVSRRKRHSSGKPPVARLIVRMSSHRNQRLLCPEPAKGTMASNYSCRSPVGPGTLTGANFTCGSDAIPQPRGGHWPEDARSYADDRNLRRRTRHQRPATLHFVVSCLPATIRFFHQALPRLVHDLPHHKFKDSCGSANCR